MFNEQRQSMVQRLKVVEKEREGLESKKAEAESFLDKQVQLLTHKATAALINVSKFKVSEAGSVWGKGRGWPRGVLFCHSSKVWAWRAVTPRAVLEENSKA